MEILLNIEFDEIEILKNSQKLIKATEYGKLEIIS